MDPVKYIKGGVARNIAECMSKIGTRPFMISVVGNDMAGDFLLNHWRLSGLCTEGAVYELLGLFAYISYAQENFLTPNWIYRFRSRISSAPLLMLDANLPYESLKAACTISVVKGQRIAPIAEFIACTTPNEIELIAMANALSPSVKYNFHKMDQCKDKAETVEHLFEMLRLPMFFLLEKGIKLLIVTLGSKGVFLCWKRHINFMNNQHKCKHTPFSTQLLEKLDGCFASETHVNLYRESSSRTCVFHLPAISASVVSLVGAGDCLVAGVLSALCGGLDFMPSVAVGVAIAKASVESETNIPDTISAGSVADDARRILLSAKRLW
ncbi:hypothetical protein PR202_gb02064 [Eleusine coracana subsp. coracana]|uniref:Carbohydrate kinase PfkB domain-containing protein n=1 Tax=Eleusine coracana subsp. coracana TaxID=191504 RepID=A0AAV5DXN5_ELECO|nr:hypothetical protein PR202_gb02064 [Eleusine coracana subsp. coracana]